MRYATFFVSFLDRREIPAVQLATVRRLIISLILAVSIFSAAICLFFAFRQLSGADSFGRITDSASSTELWHVMAILPSENEPTFQLLADGIRTYGEESAVAVEFRTPRSTMSRTAEIERFLEIAFMAELDGVLLYVTNDEILTPYINKLELAGIPVITLESDAPRSRRSAYIGTSGYDVGRLTGEIARETGRLRINAVFVAGRHATDTSSKWNSIYYGIKTVMSNHPSFDIPPLSYLDDEDAGVETIARRILFLAPETNIIFCGGENATIAVSRVVKEFGADIDVVGYGRRELMQQEIDGGMIFGAVLYDPVEIGSIAIKTLEALKGGRYVASQLYTDIEISFGGTP